MSVTTRLASLTDRQLLRHFVYVAVDPDGAEPPDDVLARPAVVAFIDDWGRPGDAGVIAEDGLEPVGGAWFRILPEVDTAAGYDADVPEMVIAVEASHRGRGVGDSLLNALFDKARIEGFTRLGLTVPVERLKAVSLFERHRFERVREVDGLVTMQAQL